MSARWLDEQSPELIAAIDAFRALTPYDQVLLATWAFATVTNRTLSTEMRGHATRRRTAKTQESCHA